MTNEEWDYLKFRNRIANPKYINVSCELLDYKPRTIEELLVIQNKLYGI